MGSRRCYRIIWRDGQPHVEVGQVVEVGGVRKRWKAQYPSGEKFEMLGSFSIKDAIETEILAQAYRCSNSTIVFKGPLEAWSLVAIVTRLYRLYRKLEDHGVIPRSPSRRRHERRVGR